jgi:hypothetical protein
MNTGIGPWLVLTIEGRYYIETEDRPVSKDAELSPGMRKAAGALAAR